MVRSLGEDNIFTGGMHCCMSHVIPVPLPVLIAMCVDICRHCKDGQTYPHTHMPKHISTFFQ